MKFGDYRVEVISDCEFRLDGGAMFGVVPRNLWSKACPPDDQNRIRMNMNCLFIEGEGERILIDTGIGDKWSDKHRAMYGIDRERSFDESLRTIAGRLETDHNRHQHASAFRSRWWEYDCRAKPAGNRKDFRTPVISSHARV
jgi:hypothetical protein